MTSETRKVVQLSTDEHGHMVALCDDGTIWRRQRDLPDMPFHWYPIPGPPGTGLYGTGYTGPAKPADEDDTEAYPV